MNRSVSFALLLRYGAFFEQYKLVSDFYCEDTKHTPSKRRTTLASGYS